MKLLVGLGNPGRSYEKTRHNIGSRVLKQFALQEKIDLKESSSLKAIWGKGARLQEEVRIVLPQSFMNLSGRAVSRCLKRWNVPPERTLVIVDDLHLPLGTLRIRPSGSDGGQKGLQSIIETVGTKEIPRLRVGICPDVLKEPWEEFVLKPFHRKEESKVTEVIEAAAECCRLWVDQGIEACMNRFNRKGLS